MALILFLVFSLCITCNKVNATSKIKHQGDNDFDCVDVYKQPALQHPLLKNHKIQFYPTFAKNIMQSRGYYEKALYGCPMGKVPIYKRIKRHQMNTNSSLGFQIDDFHQFSESSPGYHAITLDTTQNTIFHGASAEIAGYNLSLQQNQVSLSSIYIENGPPIELNGIKVGHGVHPSLYGDNQLRLTGQWTVDGYKKTGCYNLVCPGFVQVSHDKELALGSLVHPTNTIGSNTKFRGTFKVKQDQSTGHWWLILEEQLSFAGYWPKELFNHLNNGASLIRFGGEVYAPPNMPSPPMGSGRLPKEGFKNSDFMGILKIIDSQYNEIEINKDIVRSNTNNVNPNCYDLRYNGFNQGPLFRQAFLYGGPGGLNCGV